MAAAALAVAASVTDGRAADIVLPWPDPRADRPAGIGVTFPSTSPFTLADVGGGPESDPPTTARGTFFIPKEATPQRPVPGVVLLHGAAGIQSVRELTYGRQLAATGVAALVVDVFGARTELATGFIDRLLNITESMFLADAFSALRYLDARPDVDSRRVALVGFSYGGMATIYAAHAQVADAFAGKGPRFAAHAAYYAPCIAEFDDPRATGAPLLMQYGGRDAIIDHERCALTAERLKKGGAEVETIVYPQAVHQWDGYATSEREIGRSLAGCAFVVGASGTVRDKRLLVPMVNPFLRKVMLGLCADEEGYLIGRNDEVRTESNRALAGFLARAFDRVRD